MIWFYIFQLAEMELKNVTLEKLDEDRCKWRQEINTALNDYKSAKEASNNNRKQEGLEEVKFV